MAVVELLSLALRLEIDDVCCCKQLAIIRGERKGLENDDEGDKGWPQLRLRSAKKIQFWNVNGWE